MAANSAPPTPAAVKRRRRTPAFEAPSASKTHQARTKFPAPSRAREGGSSSEPLGAVTGIWPEVGEPSKANVRATTWTSVGLDCDIQEATNGPPGLQATSWP